MLAKVAALLVVSGTCVGAPAHAWVQYLTGEAAGCGLRWYADDTGTLPTVIPVQLDDRGVDGVTLPELQKVTQTALTAWQTTTCAGANGATSPVRVAFSFAGTAPPTAVGGKCKDDAVPCKIKESNGNFVRAIKGSEDWPYGSTVFALTYLTYDTCTGEIVDGDVLLDDKFHKFCGTTCAPTQQSLSNTLTHEIGHLLGLDHSQASEATMDNSGPSGQTKKSTLHGDDRQGVCAIYTGGCGRTHNCKAAATAGAATQASGCQAAPTGPGTSSAAVLGASCGLVGLWLTRRKWSRR